MIIIKIIKNTLISLSIITIFLIPVFIYFVKFNNTSFFAERLKIRVLKTPGLVGLLNLNNPGDARYLYLDSDNQHVSIGVISVNSKKSHESLSLWLDEIVSETLGKNAIVGDVQNVEYPKTELLTNENLNELRNDAVLRGKKDLYLIYISSYFEKESYVGIVIHRDTIFIFRDGIEALSEKGHIKDVLEKTTIMHEWGHLLGVEHIENENCIMDESVEIYDKFPKGKSLPTKYCWEELQEIRKIN